MFLDTSVLIDLVFVKDKAVEDYLRKVDEKGDSLYFSVIQVGEFADWCHSKGKDPTPTISLLEKMCYFTNLTEDLCLEGSRIKHEQRRAGKKRFSLIDGCIVASAKNIGEELLTRDRDFEGLENVIVL